ncbi:glycosyltransferase [Acinetobacter johnsonii]|uniref:glycosyltransferase n=1 Tax=Acinetobacter johnsonii TaxID=40214 RepID=UPI0021CD531B|nr:glycosyltransferase [Acinetobacter johnsonii]MCU4325316.1 glycosyltransferase [Acinetobacter johnsonii]
MITLSIIVPVYGVERYILSFCNSLIKQLNECVELIFIDDGSQDKSIENIKNFIYKNNFLHKNIIFLEQLNQGQSVARNYGVSVAKGVYIAFLDPDDTVKNNYVERILEVLVNVGNIDILEYNADMYKEESNSISKIGSIILCNKTQFYKSDEVSRKKHVDTDYWYSWVRVFKKNILPINLFPKGYIYEDMMALPQLYTRGTRIYGLNESLVNYLVHGNNSLSVMKKSIVDSSAYGVDLYKKLSIIDEIYVSKYIKFIEIHSKNCVKFYGFLKAVKVISPIVKEFRRNKKEKFNGNLFIGNFYLINLFLYFIFYKVRR